MFKLAKLRILPKRLYSSKLAPINILEQLKERSLIRVSGSEVSEFLQGLITNDMNHLSNGPGCMYAMFLNTKGRVLYDSIIYRTTETNTYLIECDLQGLESLQKHLKMYRVRRKIDITSLDNYRVYALFNSNLNNETSQEKNVIDGFIVPCSQLNESLPDRALKTYKDLLIYKDPRIVHLGLRIISKTSDTKQQISEIVQLNSDNKINYRWFRYSLGVGEGTNDLPPGNCFALESNCDYLHGVSFHKGCYIGQELTARIHHTGIVRKRLMPIQFTKAPKETQENILQDNVKLGKLRGVENNVGLGLLYISKVLDLKQFSVGDGIALVHRPSWWPIEAPKQKLVDKV